MAAWAKTQPTEAPDLWGLCLADHFLPRFVCLPSAQLVAVICDNGISSMQPRLGYACHRILGLILPHPLPFLCPATHTSLSSSPTNYCSLLLDLLDSSFTQQICPLDVTNTEALAQWHESVEKINASKVTFCLQPGQPGQLQVKFIFSSFSFHCILPAAALAQLQVKLRECTHLPRASVFLKVMCLAGSAKLPAECNSSGDLISGRRFKDSLSVLTRSCRPQLFWGAC